MFDEGSLTPTIFIPSEVAEKTGIVVRNESTTSSNMTVSDEEDEGDSTGSEISYLYYPVIPESVRHPAAAVNESSVLVKFANGSLVPVDRVNHADMEFRGVTTADDEDDLVSRSERSVDGSSDKAIDKNRAAHISHYFSLISTLDMMDCFSRLVCEIGWSQVTNSTDMYGQYGTVVGSFFNRLNASDFEDDSRAGHYISRFDAGKDYGRVGKNVTDCLKGSACRQDLISLVKPIMG
jgi:hypothetical protein